MKGTVKAQSRARRVAVRGTAMCAMLFAAGCYEYRAFTPAAVPAGEEVRVDLTDQGRVSVTPLAGAGVDRIDGTVETTADSSLILRVAAVRRHGVDETWTGERLRIARQDVEQIATKHFSALHTAELIGVAALAATTIKFGSESPFLG